MRIRFLTALALTGAALLRSEPADGKPFVDSRLRGGEGGVVAADAAAKEGRRKGAQRVPEADQAVAASPVADVAGTANDLCANAAAISGEDVFSYNSSTNMLDGAPACEVSGESQIDKDEWFCWTAPQTPCSGDYVVSTCGTLVDTKIAVYAGCNCANTTPIACSDDDCGLQTHLPFTATPGSQYLIRIGVFPGEPGGPGSFSITCRPPLPCEQPGSHCQSPTVTGALTSSRSTAVVADDFTPTSSGNVTGVCWWGTYQDDESGGDCQGVAPDMFVVKYYADSGGGPGNLLATFMQSDGSLAVQGPTATGLSLPGNIPEYEFSATHAALPVVADECYWIEVSNGIPGCSWLWELGINRNQRAFQDGQIGVPDGYEPEEAILDDLAFCLSTPLGDSTGCLPPAPGNDACVNAMPLNAEGEVFFDIAGATGDGPPHAACLSSGQNQITKDIWYCLTAPCSGDIFVRTCGGSLVDTRIAVYNGCTCPVTSAALLACNDDICGDENALQSMVVLNATQGQQYMIRLGAFPSLNTPGGPGFLDITCGPPDHPGCPAAGSCCTTHASAGCSNENCCESVCACDPFCCEVTWDSGCAGNGFGGSGCGASALCDCQLACGNPEAGDCCAEHANPSCSDQTCCDQVCACDSFCCTTEWDDSCAGFGVNNNGCGADVVCAALCCPNGAADADCDGDVDLADYNSFRNCMLGPGTPHSGGSCPKLDANGDGRISLFDFASFQNRFDP